MRRRRERKKRFDVAVQGRNGRVRTHLRWETVTATNWGQALNIAAFRELARNPNLRRGFPHSVDFTIWLASPDEPPTLHTLTLEVASLYHMKGTT